MLPIKQSLQLLNALSLRLKHKVMLSIRQSYEVQNAVILLNPIQMVNYPACRQQAAICLFPYQDMFKHIDASFSSRVVWCKYHSIAFRILANTTFPVCTVVATPSLSSDLFPAINAKIGWSFLGIIGQDIVASLTTYGAFVARAFTISTIFHNKIISVRSLNVK